MKRSCICLAVFASLSAVADVKVVCMRPTHKYAVGESAEFEVSASAKGTPPGYYPKRTAWVDGHLGSGKIRAELRDFAPTLAPSPLEFRLRLAEQRLRAYPSDSIDFIMEDLEHPKDSTRHARHPALRDGQVMGDENAVSYNLQYCIIRIACQL